MDLRTPDSHKKEKTLNLDLCHVKTLTSEMTDLKIKAKGVNSL